MGNTLQYAILRFSKYKGPEIIRVYTQRSSMKKEVEQYNTLE